MSCVSFLINFGVNLWALDNEFHSAKDLASINNKEEILRYLDSEITKQTKEDPKRVKKLDEKARKEAERRRKDAEKRREKLEKKLKIEEAKIEKEQEIEVNKDSINKDIKSLLGSISKKSIEITSSITGQNQPKIIHSKLVNPPTKFSDLTQNSRNRKNLSGIPKKLLPNKFFSGSRGFNDFKIAETELDGKRSVRSIQGGLQRDSEIIFVPNQSLRSNENHSASAMRRGRICDVFHTKDHLPLFGLSRAVSEPDFSQHFIPEKPSIFDRPGFGSVAFRSSLSTTLKTIQTRRGFEHDGQSLDSHGSPQESRLNTLEEEDLLSDEDEIDSQIDIYEFLIQLGLGNYFSTFVKEHIDFEALMLLNEQDLEALKIPLGPRKKLLRSINDRKLSMEPNNDISSVKL